MHKYYKNITDGSTLNRKLGAGAVVPLEFRVKSSIILSQCVFLQSLIQQIIFMSHGPELGDAKKIIEKFPNPKARVDFLCSFPYGSEDVVIKKVFEYSRELFKDIYEIRNVLAHEAWFSSDDYVGSVLFSSLDEDARLLMASGRLWHKEDATPKEIYDAMIRYIRRVKIVTGDHLNLAISDIDVCGWSLMNIANLLDEEDEERKNSGRKAFFTFRGTSHLFDVASTSGDTVEFSASKGKKIYGRDGA
jgi:hypothetical protein